MRTASKLVLTLLCVCVGLMILVGFYQPENDIEFYLDMVNGEFGTELKPTNCSLLATHSILSRDTIYMVQCCVSDEYLNDLLEGEWQSGFVENEFLQTEIALDIGSIQQWIERYSNVTDEELEGIVALTECIKSNQYYYQLTIRSFSDYESDYSLVLIEPSTKVLSYLKYST